MREVIAEGRINPNVAVQLLRSANVDRRVIAAAFLTVEDKLENGVEDKLGERNGERSWHATS